MTKRIIIKTGIVAVYTDGTIVNFPGGNDADYQQWCKGDNLEGLILITSPERMAEELLKDPNKQDSTNDSPN